MTRTLHPSRIDRLREPWMLYVDGTVLTVRGATPRDLPGVALMHSRCSAKSLLDRYRTGGRQPAIAILERQLREPLSFVVATEDGRVTAVSQVVLDPVHPYGSGEIAVLVEDGWQRLGIGRRLVRHTAAVAVLTGYRQLISYPGTTGGIVHRLMAGIGTTRLMNDPQRHLHTALPAGARRGLGAPQSAPARAESSITG
jgi:GNAT superfamily N-acetyltransferase